MAMVRTRGQGGSRTAPTLPLQLSARYTRDDNLSGVELDAEVSRV